MAKQKDYTFHRAARRNRQAKMTAKLRPKLTTYKAAEIQEFLRQNNAIERVYDDSSFHDAQAAWAFLVRLKNGITELDILKLHNLLMVRQPILEYQRGCYRSVDVYVGMHKGVPPHLICTFMTSWAEKANNSTDWKTLHIEYEKIHPFVDGNGRTGRMLMNWMRLRAGLPLLIIREGKDQAAYYDWFR